MRERMVGRSAAGRWQTRRRTARAGRLLEDLEERVGGGGVELVGGVDDGDAAAAVGGAEVEEAGERADLVDGDGGAQALGLVVPGAAAEEELRRGEGGELAEDRVARAPCRGSGRPRRRRGGGRCARRGWPCRCRRGPVIAQAWCRRPVAAASRKRASAASWPKRTAVSRGCGAPGRRSGSSGVALMRGHRGGDAGGDRVGVAGGGDDAAAGGELGGEREEALAQAGLEVVAHALEAVLAAGARGEAAGERQLRARSRTRVRSGSMPMASACSASTMGRRPARATPW